MVAVAECLNDVSVNVQIIPDAAVAPANLQPLFQALVTGLTAVPRVDVQRLLGILKPY